MKFIKGLLIGIFAGLLYAFTSFFLLTSFLRENLVAIAFFGFHGLIFATVYILLNFLSEKVMPRYKEKHVLIANVLIGIISAVVSSSYSIINTFRNAIVRIPGIEANQVNKAIMLDLLYFLIGYIIIGIVIGFVVGKTRGKRGTS